jgi:hypothetical protein
MGRVSGRLAACLLAATAFAGSAAARPKKPVADAPAQAPAPEAQQRFQRALDLYEEGNLDAARAELQRAYDIAPNFKILYNLGQIDFELKDYPSALAAFEKYLADGGAKVPDARRTQVEGDIEKLKARVARVDISTDVAKADVFVDDVQVGSTPLGRSLVVSAGRRKITVSKSGYLAVTRWVDLAGGDASQVNVELSESSPSRAPAAPSPLVAPPPRAPGSLPLVDSLASDAAHTSGPNQPDTGGGRGILWGGWALAGSCAIAAGVTGALAYSASRELGDERNRQGATRADLDRRSGEVRDLALATDILGGTALVAATVTFIATVSRGGSSKSETASLRLVPSLREVLLTGQF